MNMFSILRLNNSVILSQNRLQTNQAMQIEEQKQILQAEW